MKPIDRMQFDRLLEESDFAGTAEIGLDSGPCGQPNSVVPAATAVGIDPKSTSDAFRGYQVDDPRRQNLPKVSPQASIHPFVQRVRQGCACPLAAPVESAIAFTAEEQGWGTLEAQIQDALADAVRAVLTGNRLMSTSPDMLRQVTEEAAKEVERFRDLPKAQQKQGMEYLRQSLAKVAQKHRHNQKHHAKPSHTERLDAEDHLDPEDRQHG